MSDKPSVRMFLMRCCKYWTPFIFEDFSHDGRMTLVCHRHPEPVVRYLTWRMGVEKEDFEKAIEEHEKAEKNQPPLA